MPALSRRSLMLASLLATGWLAGAGSSPAVAAPEAVLWERWSAHRPDATGTIDHDAWSGFLERNLMVGQDGINRIDYGHVGAEDSAVLAAYIDDLTGETISDYSRPEQMAYWINLYNALTVQVIIEHYPVETIRDIDTSPGLFSDGPWGEKLVTIEGEQVGLDDIEHQILRPIWQDPRIHYAVNCASIGCPNLQPAAFEADSLERRLDEAAAEFINHPRAVTVEDGSLDVSSIYHWFKDDFGGDDLGVIAHLRDHAEPALASALEGLNQIDAHHYDWRLNEVSLSPDA